VRAQHFFEYPAAWRPKLTAEFEKLLDRANNEVNHLTVHRISGSPPEKTWHTDEILNQVGAIAKEFAARASEKKLHPKVQELLRLPPQATLRWITDNVAHSNVASHAMT
jgi:hypothetical protein